MPSSSLSQKRNYSRRLLIASNRTRDLLAPGAPGRLRVFCRSAAFFLQKFLLPVRTFLLRLCGRCDREHSSATFPGQSTAFARVRVEFVLCLASRRCFPATYPLRRVCPFRFRSAVVLVAVRLSFVDGFLFTLCAISPPKISNPNQPNKHPARCSAFINAFPN